MTIKRTIQLLVAALTIIAAVTAGGGVVDTKHNFSSPAASPNAFFYGTTQVCVFCHAPHNSSTIGPLFNHENNPAQSYQMYDSDTMDMVQSLNPHDGSLVCLSCHDGTIAVNSLNNAPGASGAGLYGSPGGSGLDGSGKISTSSHAFVGTDLQNDHPVGLTYDSTKDTNFHPKTGNSAAYPDKLLWQGFYVECVSCHNPHDNTYTNFLIESNTNSALCMRCHIK